MTATKSLTPGWEIFVATDGSANGNGTRAPRAGKGGPVATVAQAIELARQRLSREGALPAGGIAIRLRGGDYVLDRSIEIREDALAAKGKPLVIAPYQDERVRLLGGPILPESEAVTDASIRARIRPEALPHIRQYDLRRHDIADAGKFSARGFNRSPEAAHAELFVAGRAMPLAQWPKTGWATIAGVGEPDSKGDGHGNTHIGKLESGFTYQESQDAIQRWKDLSQVLLFGYWSWDWAGSYELIDAHDPAKRLIRTRKPYGLYNFRPGQRFRYLNVLEELSAGGEYCLDAERGRIYFYPPCGADAAEVMVSALAEPCIRLEEASHVVIRGLEITACRGMGMVVRGGTGVRIEDCRLRNIGNHGILIEGGVGHVVTGCEIAYTGDSGIEVSGGDRTTLTPCGHRIHANRIHHFSRWNRCYTPAVQARGVGITISNNFLHDAPHSAIIYWGNDILIERNEIRNVCWETDDCGAIYTGRDYTARGNIIRHNLIQGVYGSKTWADAIYMDDCVSGQLIEGNIIIRAKVAVQLGGGRDLIVRNNIFVGCETGITFDGRGTNTEPTWHRMINVTMRERYNAMSPDRPPYSTRYPELAELTPLFESGKGIPGKITVERTITVDGPLITILWGALPEQVTFGENLTHVDPGFADIAREDFRFPPDSPAAAICFEPIPRHRIGLPPAVRKRLCAR